MKAYIYHGKKIFVGEFKRGCYSTVWVDSSGALHRVALSKLPIRRTPEIAQLDLDLFARERKLKELDLSAHARKLKEAE